MGIINVTPDSFSDGGKWLDADRAIAHGKALAADGAHILDVGGESTRPGAGEVSIDEEIARVVPVIEELRHVARISIDTRKPDVARAAVAAGADLINDVSASLWEVAAETGAGWVAMHMQGEPQTMQRNPTYDDVVTEVRDFLVQRAEVAAEAGVGEIWIDPGFGFGKTLDHNLELLRGLEALTATGIPLAIGVSRKTFLGRLTVGEGDTPPPPEDRDDASLAAAVWAITKGAGMIRVHDVRGAVSATRVIGAIQHSRRAEEQAA
jgi:dihydropteroate synthase